jgi:nitrite reductase/ring-hydroxylating ferredoxin subunit
MSRKDGSSTKPLWAEEFSVHGAEDAYVLRRQFTKFLVLTSLAMTTGNAWIWLRSVFAAPAEELPEAVVARASEIPVGGVKLFAYPRDIDPAILVRKPDGELVAFSQKCTHLACAVFYSAEHNRLECPCHVGYFSVDSGRVLQGPPPRPLPRIRIEERGGQVIATGVDLDGGGHE